MDKTLAEIVDELTASLLDELQQIKLTEEAGLAGDAGQHWTDLRVRSHIEQASTRTKLAIQNAIVRMP